MTDPQNNLKEIKMKSKIASIALATILIGQSTVNSVLAYEYQEQKLQTNNQVQQYNYPVPRYIPPAKKKESHIIRNTLIGITLGGVATVGFLIIGTLAAFDS